MLLVSDVHGAFDGLSRVAKRGETLLVLGDLLNLMDYRTGEGIIADVLGLDFAHRAAAARAIGDYRAMSALWSERVGNDWSSYREAFDRLVVRQYEEMREALSGCRGYVTFGNVDRPRLLESHLPEGFTFVDGEAVEIDGLTVGFVGGGIATPLAAQGEVTDEEMSEKLDRLGPVDVLCSHLPPPIAPLHHDVITGRAERASGPILEFLRRHQPAFHFFGDIHQPQATRWRVGRTRCRNVGYFRATERPIHLDPSDLDAA